jgi:TonB family protein
MRPEKFRRPEFLRSRPPFDEAAIERVRQWEYTPTTINGIATSVKVTVTVEFRR